MLGNDHSLIGGSDDAWSGGVVGLFGRLLSFLYYLVCVPPSRDVPRPKIPRTEKAKNMYLK